MNIGFLYYRRQRLLHRAARLQERRKIRARPQAGDLQFHLARAGLPVPLAIAIALRQPLGYLDDVIAAAKSR